MIYLVIGGARSGKSSFAEKQALAASETKKKITYIATATSDDNEMAIRIKHHQQSRPKDWLLIEEPLYLSKIITEHSDSNHILIIECMTLWLSNWLCSENSKAWYEEKKAFITALKINQSHIIIVSNEVGSGIVPMGELSREFVDQAGWLNQTLANISNKVSLVVAGLPLSLK